MTGRRSGGRGEYKVSVSKVNWNWTWKRETDESMGVESGGNPAGIRIESLNSAAFRRIDWEEGSLENSVRKTSDKEQRRDSVF
jgi:hypothetical protein